MCFILIFRCTSCNKVLYAGEFCDHDEDPYCEACYERLFAGNRKQYAIPEQRPMGEIDTTDPLQEIKSSTQIGKLDIKRFSAKHNIPEKLAKSQNKSYQYNAKLHRYMLGNVKQSLMMDGRMNYVHKKLQQRLHKMIAHQCYTFQQKLIERVDDILKQEILQFDHNNFIKEHEKTSFDPDPQPITTNQKTNTIQNDEELQEIRNNFETPIVITDLEDKNHTNAIPIKPDGAGIFAHDNESDLDTQELIALLTTKK